jgi:hypothetical protein
MVLMVFLEQRRNVDMVSAPLISPLGSFSIRVAEAFCLADSQDWCSAMEDNDCWWAYASTTVH